MKKFYILSFILIFLVPIGSLRNTIWTMKEACLPTVVGGCGCRDADESRLNRHEDFDWKYLATFIIIFNF